MPRSVPVCYPAGVLLVLPVLAGYVMAVFVMAALIIALTNAPVYEIRTDEYRDYTDSCLVELEVNELHAGGRIELPDIGPVEEPALFVQHTGKCRTAPHLYAGLWELKISEVQAAQLAGIYGASGAPDLPYKYTSSPGTPYDGIPVRLLGRQNGRVIEVQDIADCGGYYKSHLVTSYQADLAMLALCGAVAGIMAGVWCLFNPASRQVFLMRLLIAACLIIMPAGWLVSTRIVVHAAEAPLWAGLLAVAGSLAGIIVALIHLNRQKG